MIASCYFTTAPDPQRKFYTDNNNVSYIREWYDSLKDEAVVFHDNLSEEFMSWFPKVEFIKVHSPYVDIFKYRWIVYFNYLISRKPGSIFFTDISDCVMVQKPKIEEGVIYCGDENRILADWVAQATIPELKKLPLYDSLIDRRENLLNAGIVGGSYQIMYDFLWLMNKMIGELEYVEKEILGDMFIFNYVVWNYFDKIVYGRPVNSIFQRYEKRNDVWFIHK